MSRLSSTMIPEGHMTLDSILEGILDDEHVSSDNNISSSPSPGSDNSGLGSPGRSGSRTNNFPASTTLILRSSPERLDQSPSSSSLSPPSTADITLDPISNIPCISIKSELPDSCTMDIMMDYSESQSSPLSSDQNSPKEIKLFEGDNNLALQTHLRQFSSLDGSTTGSTLVRPSSPESPDQHHCSSTTQPIMDRHHLLSADSIKDEDGPKRICLVCGDVASGFHYGVSSCEACKAFFKRTIQGNIEYTCPASSDCEINKRRRKACQACRFQKCLRMGMLKEGVRLDRVRGGRQKYRRMIESPYGGLHPARKLSLEENKLLIALTRCEPEPLLALPDPNLPDDQYKTLTTLSEFYDRELVGTIGWAKQIPGFGDLSLYDQMRLLHFSWSEILTLTLVFRSLPRTGRLNFAADFALTEAQANNCGLQDFFHHCSRTIERLERLGMRKEEFLILKAIVICNCDVRQWRLRDNLLSALYDCVAVIRSGNPAIHVQNILLLLPSIRQADGLVRQFWGKVQASGKLQLNKLLVEMLEAQSSK
eukprot:TCALIF_01014-PA protein Name:"Similar to ESRRG Estrogen-related receptor gamma (Pongo abelii)" AED:0.25 eAED:0.25 QI:0/0.77/0.6/1/0.66/0.7/10/1172/536